jgi:hypothetical protein
MQLEAKKNDICSLLIINTTASLNLSQSDK